MPVMRCSGEGPGSKAVGWWTSFGVAGRKKITGEACPQWRGPTVGKRRRQAGVGVTGWVRAIGEEILGGAVLGVWSTWPKRGWSGLSVVARVEQGGVAVRGWRCCWGWSWKGHRGALARGGARGGDGRVEGGQRRWHLVDWGAAVGTARGEAEVGHERRKRMKRGSSLAGHSPYSSTRRWLRR
jgi:hypothetical protein